MTLQLISNYFTSLFNQILLNEGHYSTPKVIWLINIMIPESQNQYNYLNCFPNEKSSFSENNENI